MISKKQLRDEYIKKLDYYLTWFSIYATCVLVFYGFVSRVLLPYFKISFEQIWFVILTLLAYKETWFFLLLFWFGYRLTSALNTLNSTWKKSLVFTKEDENVWLRGQKAVIIWAFIKSKWPGILFFAIFYLFMLFNWSTSPKFFISLWERFFSLK